MKAAEARVLDDTPPAPPRAKYLGMRRTTDGCQATPNYLALCETSHARCGGEYPLNFGVIITALVVGLTARDPTRRCMRVTFDRDGWVPERFQKRARPALLHVLQLPAWKRGHRTQAIA